MDKGISIKDMLKQGISPSKLMQDLEAQIAEAQAEIDAEHDTRVKEEGIASARTRAIEANLDYMAAIGMPVPTDEAERDELIAAMEDDVKSREKMLCGFADMLAQLADKVENENAETNVEVASSEFKVESKTKGFNPDSVIADFLKMLG